MWRNFCAVLIHLTLTILSSSPEVTPFVMDHYAVAISRKIRCSRPTGRIVLWKMMREGSSLELNNISDSDTTVGSSSPTTVQYDYDKLVEEYNDLQNQLQYIYYLEQRNEAQLGSFVSPEAQWLAQDEDDRIMLSKKSGIKRDMDAICAILKGRENM